MPLLEYRCSDCGHVTEVLVRGQAESPPACEECGGRRTEKIFSAFSAQVKQSAPATRCEACPSGNTCPMR